MARAATSELVVPLRKAWNITRFKRAPRAIQIIRDEVIRHLKVLPEEEIYIDPSVNEKSGNVESKSSTKNPLTVIRHDEPDIPIEVKLFEEA